MSLTAGQQALIYRLVTMSGGTNVVLPNGPGKGLPRYVVQVSGGAQRTATLGGRTDATPEIVVQVETEADDYVTANNALVAALVARFAVGSRFDGVTITDAPLPRPALVGGGVYSVPVVVRGQTSF